MKKLFHPLVVGAVLLLAASHASAGELKLSMANGRVTLIAQDVPVRQILAEWARIGNTKIVNAEKVVGPAVTLHLIDRPEREVLDAVLRHVAGYVAAPRAQGNAGAAVYDRVFILATSNPPAYTPVATAPTFTRPQTPVPMPDDDPVDPNGIPPGAQPPGGQPRMLPQPGMPGPQAMPVPGMMGNQPGAPGNQPPANQPLTAPRPGMLPAPPPGQTANPYVPPQPVRPGGGRGGGQ